MKYRAENEFFHPLIQGINRGYSFDSLMDSIYEGLQERISFNRLGVATLCEDRLVLTSRYNRSDGPLVLSDGYSCLLRETSLGGVVSRGEIRILNDLEQYLVDHPQSESTSKMLDEGMLSSLTLPLINDGHPAGVIFFSSRRKGHFKSLHKATFRTSRSISR